MTQHLEDTPRVVRYTWALVGSKGKVLESSNVIALLVKRGRSRLHLIVGANDGAVKYWLVPLAEERHMTDVDYRNKPYPVKRAAKLLLRRWRKLGGHDRARDALKALES